MKKYDDTLDILTEIIESIDELSNACLFVTDAIYKLADNTISSLDCHNLLVSSFDLNKLDLEGINQRFHDLHWKLDDLHKRLKDT